MERGRGSGEAGIEEATRLRQGYGVARDRPAFAKATGVARDRPAFAKATPNVLEQAAWQGMADGLDCCRITLESPGRFGYNGAMKKLIPFVLGAWVLATVGCTTTTETTTTTTRERQPSATVDPTTSMSRTERMPERGPH
jgi:hypothetical protein